MTLYDDLNALALDIARHFQCVADSSVLEEALRAAITAASRPGAPRGLSAAALTLARAIAERSQFGLDHDPELEYTDVCTILSMSPGEAEVVMDELVEAGWMRGRTNANAPIGVAFVGPTLDLFLAMDPLVMRWHPKEDAEALLTLIRERLPAEGFLLEDADRALSWGPRRLNVAAKLLVRERRIDAPEAMGTGSYAFHHGRLLPRGRRQ
jgi:hypothetical protein